MQDVFFVAVNGQQEGPLNKEALKLKNITPDTLIWHPGLPTWVKASEIPDLADLFIIQAAPEPPFSHHHEVPEWFAMLNDTQQIGPMTLSDLVKAGITPHTHVWRNGLPDWQPASFYPEIMDRLNPKGPDFRNNPLYDSPNFNFRQGNNNGTQNYGNQYAQNPYNQYQQDPYQQNPYNQNGYNQNRFNNPYNNPYNRPQAQTNWLPWAIAATIAGFLCSCIGAIFGIIGIVQANKANNLFASNNFTEGDRVNSNAKLMTIIGFIFAGIGLLVGISTGFSFLNM